ncbi:Pleckstrin y domain-containing family H member 1 [Liparis tanakae]|uniref:Pleckstrin y domain-containing family H member 1 n=1 Tax=Liparis tanakae TaxID=230148 RepID=A0A4Z2FHS2_9TELE|nr:Pleckstrin y domain-containing family H member 1 [Liparis tanakae]
MHSSSAGIHAGFFITLEELLFKMQELEQRVTEADQRAEGAEKQIHVMEEKLKSANIQTSETESSLSRRYHELTHRVQEKDAAMKRLEAQLEKQMEQENLQLKVSNLKQTEQIMLLQDKLQALLEKPASSGPPATSPLTDAHLVPSSPLFPPSCPGTPPAQDDGWRPRGAPGAKAPQTGELEPLV